MGKKTILFLLSLAIGIGAASASAKKPKKSASQPAAEASEEPALPSESLPANPGQAAAAELLEAFGPEAAAILGRYGYVILHEKKDENPSLLFISQSLEGLTRLSPSALQLIETFKRFESGEPAAPSGEALNFLKVLKLPPKGLLTQELRSLARLLASHHHSLNSLSFSLEPAGKAEPSIFETRWGKEFAARTNADIIEDPLALTRPYFNDYFASIKPLDGAVDHFIDFARSHYQKDLTQTLDTDAKAGNASEELRAWIRRYLTDQRHLVEISRARAALKSLTKDKKFKTGLQELEDVALLLSYNPKFPAKLRKILKKGAPPALVQLTSIGLHLKKPTRLRRHELGDTATLSSGYWVDGLNEKEKASVQETTFADYGAQGIESVSVRNISRRGGGPYTHTRDFHLKDSRSFRFYSIISLIGANPLVESVHVEISNDFGEALSRMAAAEQQILDCNMAGAEDSLSQLENELEPFASDKRQYKVLLKQARSRRKKARRLVEKVAKLEELIETSREDSSPEICDYDIRRTNSAIKMVNHLPPGCDRYLPELKRQREIILRRKSDQAAFKKAVSKARWKKRFCDFEAATERLSHALAILDADPGARCGKTADNAKKAERDLKNVGAYSRWKAHFQEQIEMAEMSTGVIGAEGSDPAKSLRLLNSVIARIPSLPAASCMKGELKRARKLAAANGEGMVISVAAAAKLLPRDEDLSRTAEAILTERRKIDDAKTFLEERAEAEQLPSAFQRGPSAKPRSAAERLTCLEDGMAENAATLDCTGEPFEVSELMDLRRRVREKKKK